MIPPMRVATERARAAGRVGAVERCGAGVRVLRDEALDAHDANAGVLGDDVVDQGGVAGAARGGVEVGEDRQWRQGDRDVLREIGVGARRVAERVAATRLRTGSQPTGSGLDRRPSPAPIGRDAGGLPGIRVATER